MNRAETFMEQGNHMFTDKAKRHEEPVRFPCRGRKALALHAGATFAHFLARYILLGHTCVALLLAPLAPPTLQARLRRSRSDISTQQPPLT